jgi:hypothetical protein
MQLHAAFVPAFVIRCIVGFYSGIDVSLQEI